MRRRKRDGTEERDGRHLHGLDCAWFVPADVRCRIHRVQRPSVRWRRLIRHRNPHRQCDVRRVPGGELLRRRVCNARPVLERDSLHGRVCNSCAVPGGKLLQHAERSDPVPGWEPLR